MNTGSSQFQAPSAVAVVNALLMRALAQGDGGLASPKAQDLLYLAHGWQLATVGRPLISGGFLADADGAFSPAARAAGCRGTQRLQRPLRIRLPQPESGGLAEHTPVIHPDSPVQSLLDMVWKQWGGTPAFELRSFIRGQGTPWDLVWNQDQRHGDAPRRIPESTIRCWFNHYVGVRGTNLADEVDGLCSELETAVAADELWALRPA